MSYFSKMLDLFLFVYSIEYAGAVAPICNKAHYAGDSTCLEGYEMLPGTASCARLIIEFKPWEDARKDCQKDGADLFVANTSAARKALDKIDLLRHSFTHFFAWIGLHETAHRTDKFVWLDQTKEAKDIPWDVGEPLQYQLPRCVYARPGYTKWTARGCEKQAPSVCQQILGPEPRRISVDIPSSTDTGVTVRISKKLSVICTAYHSSDAEITFLIYPGDKSVYSTENITSSDPRMEIKEDKVYDWDSGHCGLKTVAVLTVEAMEKHHLGSVSCCRSKPNACEKSMPIKIEFLQKESETEIRPLAVNLFQEVNVTCTVYAEDKYNLTWDISPRQRSKKSYRVDRGGNLYQTDSSGWRLLKAGSRSSFTYTNISAFPITFGHRGVVHKKSIGPVIISTITLNATLSYNNTRFDCYKNRSEIKFSRAVFVKVMTTPKTSRKKAPAPATDSTKAISDFKPDAKSELCKEEDFNARFPCDSKDFIDLKNFGTCIKFFEEPLNWDSARSSCIYHHQADLVRITSKEFDQELTGLMPNKSKNYWIGLHDQRRPGQFRWLDDNQEAHRFNWEKGLPKQYKRGFACGMKTRNGGLWSHAPCLDKMFFICQKVSGRNPGKVQLDVSFPLGCYQAHVGQTVKALCSSFTYGAGNFKFGFQKNKTFTLISDDDSHLSKEDKAYELDGDRCFMKSRALLYINVTKEMDGANLSCCWRHPAGFLSCTKTQHPVEIKFLSHTPVMEVSDEVLYINDVIVVNCSAYVGTGGELVWRLKTRVETREWWVGLDGTYRVRETENTKNDVFNTTQSTEGVWGDVVARGFEAEADDIYGPRILSTFSLAVTSDLHGATLSCVSFNPNTKDKIVTSSVFTVFSHRIQDTTDSGISMAALLFWALLIAVLLALGGGYIFLMPTGAALARKKSTKRPAAPQKKKGRAGKHIKTSLLQLSKKKKKKVKSRERHLSLGSSVDWDSTTNPEGETPDYRYDSILSRVSAPRYGYHEEAGPDYTESTAEGTAYKAGSAV